MQSQLLYPERVRQHSPGSPLRRTLGEDRALHSATLKGWDKRPGLQVIPPFQGGYDDATSFSQGAPRTATLGYVIQLLRSKAIEVRAVLELLKLNAARDRREVAGSEPIHESTILLRL